MPHFIHKEMAGGGWAKLTLAAQMGNIGSEISRASLVEGKDDDRFTAARDRALDLFDLTLEDSRWKGRRREIARAREVFCDATYGGELYGSSLKSLMPYFDAFALAARSHGS